MEKCILFNIFLLLLLSSCSSQSNKQNSKITEPLEIENCLLTLDEEKNIESNISDEFSNQIIYSFQGNNISIEDGVVKGLVPYTSTLVNAKYLDTSTTFVVEVDYDYFGVNEYSKKGNNEFIIQSDYSFANLGLNNNISYLYSNKKAVSGEVFALSGTLSLTKSSIDSVTSIVFNDDTNNSIEYNIRYNSLNSYSLYSKVINNDICNTTYINNFDNPIVNFFIIFKNGNTYFFVNDKLLGTAKGDIKKAHVGFSSLNTCLKLERLHSSSNLEMIDSILSSFNYPFGAHATNDAEIHSNMFRDLGDGKYLKRTYHYAQQFMYLNGKAMYGTNYASSGVLEMINPKNAGQICLMFAKSDGNMLRFVFEFYNNQYHIFTDKKVNGVFGEYRNLYTCTNRIHYMVSYGDGFASISINGQSIAMINYPQGNVHLGIGSDNTQFIISSIDGNFVE